MRAHTELENLVVIEIHWIESNLMLGMRETTPVRQRNDQETAEIMDLAR
jgi:hypothetical protein